MHTSPIDLGTHTLRVAVLGSGTPVLACLHGLADSVDVWGTGWRRSRAPSRASPTIR